MTNTARPDAREALCVLRAQAGDREALDHLLRQVQQPLFRYIRGIVRDDALAADVLQDAFVRICRKLVWLREPKAFRPWAFRIASREAFRQLRRNRGSIALTEGVDMDALPAAAGTEDPPSDIAGQLPELIADLPPASRAVIALRYLEDMPLAEIAVVLDVPLGTVKSRLAYGLTRLREQLGTSDGQPEDRR